jgi:hypothetical protein
MLLLLLACQPPGDASGSPSRSTPGAPAASLDAPSPLAGDPAAPTRLGAAPPSVPGAGGLVLNEVMTRNDSSWMTADGRFPDWIELYNPGPDTVNLLDWSLTDVATNLTKWRFPPTNIAPGGFVIVFASDKNHRVPGRPLHANFRLNDGGEYLALVGPDGTNVVSEFAPAFRPQFPNVSFGVAAAETVQLLAPDAPLRAFVPVDDSLGTAWRNPGFDDSAWTSGSGGAGSE